jgi:hypothetical protein
LRFALKLRDANRRVVCHSPYFNGWRFYFRKLNAAAATVAPEAG